MLLFLLNIYKQNMMSLSLLAGRTVIPIIFFNMDSNDKTGQMHRLVSTFIGCLATE